MTEDKAEAESDTESYQQYLTTKLNNCQFQRYLIVLCLLFAIVFVNATPEPVAEAEAEADSDDCAYYECA